MHIPTLSLSLFALLGIWTLSGERTPASTAGTTHIDLLAGPQRGNHPYTVRSLEGRHGFSYDGHLVGIGPVASSGRIDFDGAGNVRADYTTSVNGTTFTGSFTGSYTVDANGTGAIVIHLPRLRLRAHGRFVLVDRGSGTFFTSTDAGFSVAGRTTRM